MIQGFIITVIKGYDNTKDMKHRLSILLTSTTYTLL